MSLRYWCTNVFNGTVDSVDGLSCQLRVFEVIMTSCHNEQKNMVNIGQSEGHVSDSQENYHRDRSTCANGKQ